MRMYLAPYHVRDSHWIMVQHWHDLLFAHWPVPPEMVLPLLPAGLPLDTFGGQAWVGVVVFRLSGIRLRGLPPFPPVSSFNEINVRTYVAPPGRPGVYFLSMDADNPLAMAIARPWFRLPYTRAAISMESTGGAVSFTGHRIEPGVPDTVFDVSYGPCSAPYEARPGSLDHWLTERYSYYTPGHTGKLYRCDIYHPQWPLQQAWARVRENTMLDWLGISVQEGTALLHYARHMRALIWPLRHASGKRTGIPPLPQHAGSGITHHEPMTHDA
jgi:uncharacterized protein YqjF (DUF2071 family)